MRFRNSWVPARAGTSGVWPSAHIRAFFAPPSVLNLAPKIIVPPLETGAVPIVVNFNPR